MQIVSNHIESMHGAITKITHPCAIIDRLHIDTGVIVDVYNALLQCHEGDVLKVTTHVNQPKPTEYLMHGHVYRVDGQSSCISCGGLLCHIPKQYQIYSNLYLSIEKTKKTRSSRQEQKSTRQRK